jgi:hypothetical protein
MKNTLLKSIATMMIISCTTMLLGCSIPNTQDNKTKENIINNEASSNPNSKENNELLNLQKKKEKVLEDLNILAEKLSKAADDNTIKSIISDYYNLNKEDTETIYFALETGEFYMYPEDTLPEDYDARKREWYIKAMENKVNISEPFQDILTLKYYVAFAQVVVRDGKNIGVIGIDKFAN